MTSSSVLARGNGRSRHLAWLLVMACAVLVFLVPAAASAAPPGPTWPYVTPTGNIGDHKPVIQAYVDNSLLGGGTGDDVVAPVSISLSVGGFPVAAGATAEISYPNGPADHTVAFVTLDLSGTSGLEWTKTYDVLASVTVAGTSFTNPDPWQFYVDVPPSVASVLPAANHAVTNPTLKPTISVSLIDPDDSSFTGTLGAGRFLRITRIAPLPQLVWNPNNGTTVGTVRYDAATKTFSYSPLTALTDNATYTVEFGAEDSASDVAYSWTFFTATTWQGAITHLSPTVPVTNATGLVELAVQADDARFAIDPTDPANTMSLDGSTLAATFSSPVSGDLSVTRGTAHAALTDGSHRLVTRVTDSEGLVGTDTWDFTVQSPPVATDLAPVGTIGDARPVISAKVTDNSPGSITVTMTVDDVIVGCSFDSGTGVLGYRPETPLSMGVSHDVEIGMRDAAGNFSTAAWTFRVDVIHDAVFSDFTPAAGAVVLAQPASLRVTASSETPLVRTGARLEVDGVARATATQQNAPSELVLSGVAQSLSPGTHTVRATVTDSVGHSTTTSWQFDVVEIPACASCHIGAPPNHADPTPPCTDCHTPAFPTIPRHTDAALTAAHVPVIDAGCTPAGCHPGSLVTVHAADGCMICHGSGDQAVKDAIDAGNRDCAACHPDSATRHNAAHDGGLTDSACEECHVSNISAEHDGDCRLCHTSIKARVKAAIKDGVTTCAACHGKEHLGGQDYIGAADPAQGVNMYVYLQWSDMTSPTVLANIGSPHGGYTTTSVKCAICHSVHVAAPGGSATSPVADTLLRFNAQQACAYCHVASGHSVTDPVFGGNVDAIGDAGHALGSPACSECHAGVHGVDVENEVASLRGKMLTLATDYGTGPGGTGSTILSRVAAIEALATAQGYGSDPKVTGFNVTEYEELTGERIEAQAVGLFCSGCHDGSYAGTVRDASASTLKGQTAGMFTGHITMASASGSSIAYAPADSCASCHDADDGFGGAAFPHNWGVVPGESLELNETGDGYTNQTFAWLLSSPQTGSELTTVGGPGGKQGHAGPTGGTLADGVCLKCHRSEGAGVGITY